MNNQIFKSVITKSNINDYTKKLILDLLNDKDIKNNQLKFRSNDIKNMLNFIKNPKVKEYEDKITDIIEHKLSELYNLKTKTFNS